MKNITITELQNILENQKGATPITIEALVDARARKTGNPYEKILKLSKVNGFTGFDYEAGVNRQLVREGSNPEFVSQQRAWGTAVNKSLVEKDGKFYLTIRPLHSSEPQYFGKKGNNLIPVDKKDIEQFLPPVYPAKNQGTEKEIVFRNYALENIRKITIKNETYELVKI